MKFCSVICLLMFSIDSIAVEQSKEIIGKWYCDSYKDQSSASPYFIIDLEIEYYKDGSSVDTQVWRLHGMEEVWFTVQLSGPWNLKNGVLTEITEEERLIAISDYEKMPPKSTVEEIFESASKDIDTNISEVVELSESKLITKATDDGEITSCHREQERANKRLQPTGG